MSWIHQYNRMRRKRQESEHQLRMQMQMQLLLNDDSSTVMAIGGTSIESGPESPFDYAIDLEPFVGGFSDGRYFEGYNGTTNQFFRGYLRRRLSITPAIDLNDIHMVEVFDMNTEEYLLNYSIDEVGRVAGRYWANGFDQPPPPITNLNPVNKFGRGTSNLTINSFYYGYRRRSDDQPMTANGNIIRIRVRKYIGGNFGPDIQLGPPIAEMYFLEKNYNGSGSTTKPIIVDINGNPI